MYTKDIAQRNNENYGQEVKMTANKKIHKSIGCIITYKHIIIVLAVRQIMDTMNNIDTVKIGWMESIDYCLESA